MSNARKEIYEFDKFRLDVSERILRRGKERLPLSEKAFETLCALVRRGNHLIGKSELLTQVWADTIVEENNLDKNISLLRKVLGEREGKGKFIETVRGHGYRFVAEIREIGEEEKEREKEEEKGKKGEEEILEDSASAAELLSEPPAPADGLAPPSQISRSNRQNAAASEIENLNFETALKPEIQNQIETDQIRNSKSKIRNRRIYIFAAAVILLIAGGIAFYGWQSGEKSAETPLKSIAVLPFKSLGAENRNEALELGMADTLISKLGGEEIIVRPLGSVSRYAALDQDSLSAGRELDVETVLDGTIQTADNRIRISARLFRTSDGRQIWTGQFDERFTDIFAVQDSISEKVAAALKIRLTSNRKKYQTENVEAYQLYMKGRFYLLKGVKPETETSISYFQQAIDLDPNYALAYAGIADAYRGRVVGGEMSSGEVMQKSRAAALRAMELDDTLAEAHANLGHVMFWYDWDWNAAENQYKRALELDPNNPDALQFYAHLLSAKGRHSEALARIKLARELDPLNLRINALEGLFLLHAGRTDEAIAQLQKALELDSDYRLANMFAARAYSEKGMFAEAAAAARKARETYALSSEAIAFGAYALAKSGGSSEQKEARAALGELLNPLPARYVPPYNIALVYNALGESDHALDFLEKAFAEKDVRMVWLKVEPKWNNLRGEPRFIDLTRRMNFE